MCATSLGWRRLVNAYGVKAGWLIPLVNKCVNPPTRAIPEHITGVYVMRYKIVTYLLLLKQPSHAQQPI